MRIHIEPVVRTSSTNRPWSPGPTKQDWEGIREDPGKVGRVRGLASINTNLVLPSGKPRCMSYYFNLWITMYAYYLCIMFQELFETLVAWSLGFPRPYTSINRSLALLYLIGLDRSWVIIMSLARYRMSLYYNIWVIIFKMESMGWETGWGRCSPICVD